MKKKKIQVTYKQFFLNLADMEFFKTLLSVIIYIWKIDNQVKLNTMRKLLVFKFMFMGLISFLSFIKNIFDYIILLSIEFF